MKNVNLFAKPTHLICKENEYDISSVVSRRDLWNQVELLCAKVNHPVTIFSFYDIDSEGSMERFDSAISTVSLHYCCELFRICAGKDFCEHSDIEHALLFKGEDKPIDISNLEECVNKNIDNYMKRRNSKEEYEPRPIFVKYEHVGYIKYYCPILGYQELVFPIIVCGKVLGVIFCGQIQYGDDTIIEKIRNNFLKDNHKVFDDYFKIYSNKDKQDMIDILIEGRDMYKSIVQYPALESNREFLIKNGWINEQRPISLDEKSYDALVKRIIKAINNLSSSLYNFMTDIRKKYITHVIKNATYSFCQSVMKELFPINNEDSLVPYWENVERSINDVVEKLSLQNIQIYGTTNPTPDLGEFKSLKMISFSCPHVSDGACSSIKEHNSFKLDKQDQKVNFPFLSSTSFKLGNLEVNATPELCNRITDVYGNIYNSNSNDMHVLYYPMQDNLSNSSALVIEYCDKTKIDDCLNNNNFIKKTIITEMYPFCNLIFFIGAYMLNSLLQTTTEMILRFFRHELSHVLLGYKYLNDTYIQDFEYFAIIEDKKRQDVVGDFLSTEEMMYAISNNIEMLTKPECDLKLKIEEFKIFKELLFKWENLYKYDIESKHLSFHNPNINFDDPNRPLIKSDKRLLEQVIYNIVHNAIKYSNWGTRIEIDCKRKFSNKNSQVLTITDYGSHIELGEKPYTLYYRNHDIKENIEGSGIGLFVVKRIADILGIKIRHSCELISNYNVPLIDLYIYKPFIEEEKDKDLLRILQLEKNRLGENINKVKSENKNPVDLSDAEIIEMIKMPTYKVSFEVEI